VGFVAAALAALPSGIRARALRALGEGAYVQHRVDVGSGVALSSGTVFGGRAVGMIGRYTEVSVSAAAGTLTADSALAEEADFARGAVALLVMPESWLGIGAGVERHTFSGALAVQSWTAVRLGGEARLRLSSERLTGVLQFDFYPVVDVSGLERPNRAIGAGSGVMFRAGALTASVTYRLTRYDFPEVAGVARREQISSLTGGVGLSLGGNRR